MGPAPGERRMELDGLRALAVLAVLVAHGAEETTGALATFLGDVGSHGVDLFFVLSGFCLAYPLLLRRRDRDTALPAPFAFLRHRIARIAPPYYVAIAAFGLLALTPFGIPTWPLALPAAHAYAKQLVLDAAFLPNLHPLHNADFWTLGLEMRWYLVFPFAIALLVRSRVGFVALGIATIAVYQLTDVDPELGILPSFLFGVFAADLIVRDVPWRTRVWPAAAALLTLAVVEQFRSPHAVDHAGLIWQLASFLFVVAVTGTPAIARAFSHPWLVATGVASYSIYLVHHPLLSAFAHVGVPLPIAGVLALGGGFAFARLVEVPLLRPAVRRAIERGLTLPAMRRSRVLARDGAQT